MDRLGTPASGLLLSSNLLKIICKKNISEKQKFTFVRHEIDEVIIKCSECIYEAT